VTSLSSINVSHHLMATFHSSDSIKSADIAHIKTVINTQLK